MVARDSTNAIRFSACELALRIAPPWRRLFICRDTKRGWLVRQSAQHRDTKDNGAIFAIDKTKKADERVGSWNRWRNRRGGKKEKSENCEREKKIEWKIRGSENDSENARAKGYEMKFSSHPFCVSEGIPVRQEVPSRNRRKGKRSRLWRKRKEKRRKQETRLS